ncbi:MAG: glycosyltransferase [Pseudomonadota bacterium]
MNARDYSSTIGQIVLVEGDLYVLATPEAAAGNIRVNCGDQPLPLEPATLSPELDRRLQYQARLPLSAGAITARIAGTENDGRIGPKINELAAWSLENATTAQILVFDRSEEIEIRCASSVELPRTVNRYAFRAALAIHRARAVFRLHIESYESGGVETIEVPFDPRRRGGQFRSGYQEVDIPIPPKLTPCKVSFSVNYLSCELPDDPLDPIVFVADPSVTPSNASDHMLSPIRLDGRVPNGAIWHTARMPSFELQGGDRLTVTGDEGEVEVFTAATTRVELTADQGHSIGLRASEPGQFAFFLDGQPAMVAELGPEERYLRLPATAMTGKPTHLTVRDPSGSQVLLETYVLCPRIMTPTEVLQRETTAPFPDAIFAQSAFRFEALRKHLADPRDSDDPRQIAYALSVLEGGYDNVRLNPIAFPEVEDPDVSVVIPAHNKVEVTYFCLCALLVARNDASFEVIVVDDGSTDRTAELESFVSGIRVVRNVEPQRFIRSCNAAAAEARGDYIILLNNDTEPTAGWIDELIDAFGRFDRVGLAGAKLLFPNGRLQDAGGIVWRTGNPWNYGRNESPWDPRFSYARQADYLSGAALMTTREIWEEVGGLSTYLEPMYFEDTDLAFKIRDAGYRTYFVPSSIVYHYEGMTSGSDTSSGFKRYQEVNRPKFKRTWSRAFAAASPEGTAPDLEKDRGIRGRILFIDYTTPRPDRDAGSYAAVEEMKLVQSLGFKVTFLPENLAHFGRYTAELERSGIEMIRAPFFLSVREFLAKRGAEFDAFYVTRYHVGMNVIETIRQVAPRAKIILNVADLHFLRELRAGLMAGDRDRVAAAEATRALELEAIRSADVVLSYNDTEHAVIDSHTSGAVPVMKCPWVVATRDDIPAPDGRAGLAFLGSFRHPPNTEGIAWFSREVMPLIASTQKDLKLFIYGSSMGREVEALASSNIEPVGFVDEVAMAFDKHRVFVAPLLTGAGIKGKVLSALANGIPSVLSPVAAEGTGLRSGHDCLVAKTPEEWVSAVTSLHTDAELWTRISENGLAYMAEMYSFEKGREDMRSAFEIVELF